MKKTEDSEDESNEVTEEDLIALSQGKSPSVMVFFCSEAPICLCTVSQTHPQNLCTCM